MTGEHIRRFINKWLVPAGSVIGVLAAVFLCMAYIIRSEVSDLRSDIGGLKEKTTGLSTDIGKTNDRIDQVLTKALERAFPSRKRADPRFAAA